MTELFGGAITVTLPFDFIDASDLRQIPDTQEVWLSKSNDLTFILEILELPTDDGAAESLEAGIKFHFASLAHDNEAFEASILSLSAPPPSSDSASLTASPPTPSPAILHGTQLVSKFNRPKAEADTVLILMALYRLPTKNTDMVLTVNWPVKTGATGEEHDPAPAQEAFKQAVASLSIKDWGLFAG